MSCFFERESDSMDQLKLIREQQAKKHQTHKKQEEEKSLEDRKREEEERRNRINVLCKILDKHYQRYTRIVTQFQGRKYNETDTNFVNGIEKIVHELWEIWLDYGKPVRVLVNGVHSVINERAQKIAFWNNQLKQDQFVPTEENWKLLCDLLRNDKNILDRLPATIMDRLFEVLGEEGEIHFARHYSISQSLRLLHDRGIRLAVGNLIKNLFYRASHLGIIHVYSMAGLLFGFTRDANSLSLHIYENVFAKTLRSEVEEFRKSLQEKGLVRLLGADVYGITVQPGSGEMDEILKAFAVFFFTFSEDMDNEVGFRFSCKYNKFDGSFLPGFEKYFTLTYASDDHKLPPHMFHNCLIKSYTSFSYASYVTRRDLKDFINSPESEKRILTMYLSEESMREVKAGWFDPDVITEVTPMPNTFPPGMTVQRLYLDVSTTINSPESVMEEFIRDSEFPFVDESVVMSFLSKPTAF
jgi:hypothetical protein